MFIVILAEDHNFSSYYLARLERRKRVKRKSHFRQNTKELQKMNREKGMHARNKSIPTYQSEHDDEMTMMR